MIGFWYNEKARKATLVLKAFKCSWDRCVFCCFSDESASSYGEIMTVNSELLEKVKEKMTGDEGIDELNIFNGGSFFELPYALTLRISEVTKNINVGIETRPEFLSEEVIIKTYDLLKPDCLTVRIGFESFFQDIRERLRKGITDSQVTDVYRMRENIRRRLDDKVRFVAYVLFGIEGIEESSVMESVNRFKELFDGVIAIGYRRYKMKMPKETDVSNDLVRFLKSTCLDVDFAESPEWEIAAMTS